MGEEKEKEKKEENMLREKSNNPNLKGGEQTTGNSCEALDAVA